MRVLVTGGCGFVGSHAVAHLLDTTDWDIVVVDGLTYAGDTGRITEHHGYDPARVKVVWHDLRAPFPPSLIERIGPVDAVWSIAANSHVDRSLDDPVPFVHSNVAIATTMLEYARQVKPRVFVHCSTDEVFGPAPDGYHHHEWDTVMPSNPYAASKAAQDACAVAWWRSYGVPVVKTHTMNMFGERQNPEKFIPLAIARLAAGVPVPVHGRKTGGDWVAGSRKYLHARNLADAYRWITERGVACGVSAYPVSDRPEAWNVCGVEMTNDRVVRLIAEIMGVQPRIEWVDFHSARPGHDRRYSLDGSKIDAAGWKAPVAMREALERTIRWTLDNRHWLAA